MTRFHIVSIFPEVIEPYLESSMLWRAKKEGRAEYFLYNPRDYTLDKHRKVDGRPYGGGPGMVMAVQPIVSAVEAAVKNSGKRSGRKSSGRGSGASSKSSDKRPKIIVLSPAGKQFTNAYAKSLAKSGRDIVIIAGHYEGIDSRVGKILKAEEVSIGPYVLTGGEAPAMIVVDAVSRQIPGVLGNDSSLEDKRVSSSEIYTRPEVCEYKGRKYRVPKVLLSGHHKKIDEWKSRQ